MKLLGPLVDTVRAQEGGRRLADLTSRLTADATTTAVATTYAASGLSVSLEAGKVYEIRAKGQWQTNLATAGLALRLNGTVTVTRVKINYKIWTPTAIFAASASALAGGAVQTAGNTINTSAPWEIDGLIVVNAAGTLIVEYAAEVAATMRMVADSFLLVKEMA